MDHGSAIQKHTAERYLLRELSDTEWGAYEEFFFSQPCAETEEVTNSTEFVAAAQTVFANAAISGDHAHRGANRERVTNAKRTGRQCLNDPTAMKKHQRGGQRVGPYKCPVPRKRYQLGPPADAEYLLKFIPENEEKLVSLKIEHSKMSHQYGHFKANVWYWFQTIRSIVPHVWPFVRKVAAVTAILGLIGK